MIARWSAPLARAELGRPHYLVARDQVATATGIVQFVDLPDDAITPTLNDLADWSASR